VCRSGGWCWWAGNYLSLIHVFHFQAMYPVWYLIEFMVNSYFLMQILIDCLTYFCPYKNISVCIYPPM
jgi:hypothetical protein